MRNAINRCRPGHGASCALCCGSHNYTGTPEEIEDIFSERTTKCLMHPALHPEASRSGRLFNDALQCPNLGMSETEPGLLSCLIYRNHDLEGQIRSFFEGTCRTFYCPAWECLDDEEVVFAARLFGDWYFYSLFINDIFLVQETFAQYGSADNVPAMRISEIKDELIKRLLDEDGK